MYDVMEKSVQQEVAFRLTQHGQLFAGCTQKQVLTVIAAGLLNHHNAGDHVFWKGDQGTAMYAVLGGEVEIRLPEESGEEQVVATLGAGEVFGEMAVATGERRSAAAVAKTDVDLFVVDETEIEWLMQHHTKITSRIMLNLVRVMSERLRGELTRRDGQP